MIVPVYNVESYLPRCLDSILTQTYRDFQLILVDDGSTDTSGVICDDYAAKDGRITVIHKNNGGLSSARNAGLERAEGEFVAFVDSDDWIHPQYLELMLWVQKTKDYDLVICDHQRVREFIPFQYHTASEIPLRELNLEGVYRNHQTKSYVWNKLYRRSHIGSFRFVEEKIAEDAIFNVVALSEHADLRACFIREVLYYYYNRENSLVNQLTHADQMKCSEMIFAYAQNTNSDRLRKFFLREVLKATLSARLRIYITDSGAEDRRRCRRIMFKGLVQLWKCPGKKLGEILAFTVLCTIPLSYRCRQYWKDPSLWQWEKQERAKRRKIKTENRKKKLDNR